LISSGVDGFSIVLIFQLYYSYQNYSELLHSL